jgi:16S rRNA (cytosine1402-N4)-methyltransferase
MTPNGPAAAISPTVHVSVLGPATIAGLGLRPGSVTIDATLGGGGHTDLILDASAPDGRVLAIDADPAARARVVERLAPAIASGRLIVAAGNFRDLSAIAAEHEFRAVDGIVMDLGLSSDQLADRERGFSFSGDAPLDMRFDPTHGQTAADLLATSDEEAIAGILWRYGEERRSRSIARQIVAARARAPIARTSELARIVAAAVPGRPGGIHPATRTFQALRIAVNDELGALEAALPQALDLLAPGGRIVVISFHSLEDRIVKQWMLTEAKGCICPPGLPECVCGHTPRLRVLARHPIMAGADELAANPRAASAKLRIAERLPLSTNVPTPSEGA